MKSRRLKMMNMSREMTKHHQTKLRFKLHPAGQSLHSCLLFARLATGTMSSSQAVEVTIPHVAVTDGGPIFQQYSDFEKRVSSFDSALRDTFPPFETMGRAGFF